MRRNIAQGPEARYKAHMPELPEVETVRRGLEERLLGRTIVSVDQRRPDLRFPFPEGFAERLSGRRIQHIGRRAKYLLIHFDNGTVLIAHLGMSGRYSFEDRVPDEAVGIAGRVTPGSFVHSPTLMPGRHDHVLIDLDDGTRVVYTDHRRFGFMTLAEEGTLEEHPFLRTLGLDPLGNNLTAERLGLLMAGKRTPIKSALLDQRLIAGLGNIYACEALYRARISPKRLARSIPGRRAERLAVSIPAVLRDAIAAGGSTLRDYVHTDGALGYFQTRFDVYDRTGEQCRKPDCDGTIRRIVQSGRSTFYCPACQR